MLSQRLGHADIAITLRVYSHVLDGDDEAAADLAASFIGGQWEVCTRRRVALSAPGSLETDQP